MRRLYLALSLFAMIIFDRGGPGMCTTLHVSPEGNDNWSGQLKRPTGDRTDGPLRSLEGARDKLRELRKGSTAEGGDFRVLFQPGVYPLKETIVFGPEDSGSSKAAIVYEAEKSGTAVLSGGRPITGWIQGPEEIWTAELPDVAKGTWYFNQLFVDGKRATRARHPNDGTLRTEGQLPGFENPHAFRGKPEASKGFQYRPGDLKNWSHLEDMVLVLYHSWTNSLHWVQALDQEKRLVTFTNRSGWPVGWWEKNNQRYHVENILEALDQPGEWYLDRVQGRLYYWPREGEDLTEARVMAPTQTILIELLGDPEVGLPVSNITFRGLSFHYTDWNAKKESVMDGQAATFLPASVHLRGARGILFQCVEIAHVGGYGIWLDSGSHDNSLDQCEIHDLAGGGVRIGTGSTPGSEEEAADRNQVNNCFIHDGGHVFHGACGVLIQRASHNQITHCEISDFRYTGVSVGWSWGYAASTAHHNLITHNHIHHLGWGIMSDMGGIYCLGLSPGTRLDHNVIHHVLSYSYGGWGLYTDEGSTDIVMENNVVYKTKTGGFHQHYGKENKVQNNILAFASLGQIQRSREEDHISFFFQRNIVLLDREPALHGRWSNDQFVINNNLYWDIHGGEIDFDGSDLEDWQERGHDTGSIVANPRFQAAEEFDFQLKKRTPAKKIGFVPIDVKEAGLYGDRQWIKRPSKVKRPPMIFPEPPEPVTVDDDFETTPLGAKPQGCVASEAGKGTIRITNETAFSGKKSVKFQDSEGLEREWQPHLYYQPEERKGVAVVSFCLRMEPGSKMYHEWRTAGSPYKAGPSIHVDEDGAVRVKEQTLTTLPYSQWITLQVRCPLGKLSKGTFDLTITLPGDKPQIFSDLPLSDEGFKKLQWLGFVSTATEKRVFYLDNVKLRTEQ